MVLCASELRPIRAGGIEPLIRAAADAGAPGIHLGGGMVLDDFRAALPAVMRAGLVAPSMTLPLAERALGQHKRLPALAAADPEERGAAIALATAGLEAGVAAAVRWGLLDFGAVALPASRREVAAFFGRRELGEGEAGGAGPARGRRPRGGVAAGRPAPRRGWRARVCARAGAGRGGPRRCLGG